MAMGSAVNSDAGGGENWKASGLPPARSRRSARPPPVSGAGVHTGSMGRIIGTVLGAILAVWLAATVAGGIFASVKTFLVIGLIALAVFIVVWLVAKRPNRG